MVEEVVVAVVKDVVMVEEEGMKSQPKLRKVTILFVQECARYTFVFTIFSSSVFWFDR